MGGPTVIDGEACHATDNFGLCKFIIDGQAWVSVEQYFQAVKFVDLAYRETIRLTTPLDGTSATSHGLHVWKLGQSRDHGPLVEDWDVVKYEVMYVACRTKFEQNPELSTQFLRTKGEIHAAPSTADWTHWNGAIMTRLREELRASDERDEGLLQKLIKDFGFDEDRVQKRLEEIRAGTAAAAARSELLKAAVGTVQVASVPEVRKLFADGRLPKDAYMAAKKELEAGAAAVEVLLTDP
jgi:ribA/ribD-fused uncharacterized protein